jgi:putative transposase
MWSLTGRHFWLRGYCASTVGLDEEMIRTYVSNQEYLDKKEELDFTNNPLSPF